MRNLFLAVLIGIILLIAACVPVLMPDVSTTRVPLATPSATEISRGARDVHTLDVTATVVPGVYIYRARDGGTNDCLANYYGSVPNSPTLWVDTTDRAPACDICTDAAYICNMTGDVQYLDIEALARASGWSYAIDWHLTVGNTRNMDCTPRSAGADEIFLPQSTVIPDTNMCFAGFRGGGVIVDGQHKIVTVWPYKYCPILGPHSNVPMMSTTSLSLDFFCAPGITESHHGWNVFVDDCFSPVCITEVNASLSEEPLGPGHWNYNLHDEIGADDEMVEVWCKRDMNLWGWKLEVVEEDDTNNIYIYKQDNLCRILKVIFCDEFEKDCPTTGAGFPISGTVNLYDPDGNLMDTRPYPVTTPGMSWRADYYKVPHGIWDEGMPSPGSWDTPTP